jgi:alpha-tubulin suppressor-like RCC1 family protein
VKTYRRSAILLFCAAWICGCGSSSSTTAPLTSRVAFTVQWPAPSRLIPLAANSIKLSLSQNGNLLDSTVLARPAQGGPASAVIANLPAGDLLATATAYPNADGTGVAQARATVPVTTVIGQVSPVHLTMASTVTAVTVPAGQQVPIGATQDLLFTATDAQGSTVIVSPAALTVTVVSGIGQLQSTGSQIQGLAAGTATVTASVDGITSPPQTVMVTAVPGVPWAWGQYDQGQLCDGTQNAHSTPAQTIGLTGIVTVALGYNHGLALSSNGAVFTWGDNTYGQLGIGTTDQNPHTSPVQVPGLSNVIFISAGSHFDLAITGDGKVWGWGNNFGGQLGGGAPADRPSPVQIPGLSNVTAVSGGQNSALALKADGTVWIWGATSQGIMLPTPVSGLTNVIAIAMGQSTPANVLAVKAEGTVWAWGDNRFGELGNGTADTDPHPTPAQVGGLSGITSVATGGGYDLALTKDGVIWGWGNNGVGELGDGTTSDRYIPVQANTLTNAIAIAANGIHSTALTQNGTVWAWGDNDGTEVGDGTRIERHSPVRTSNLTNVVAISAGGSKFNMAIVGSGRQAARIPSVIPAKPRKYGTPSISLTGS